MPVISRTPKTEPFGTIEQIAKLREQARIGPYCGLAALVLSAMIPDRCDKGHHMYRLISTDGTNQGSLYRCEDCGDEDPEGSQCKGCTGCAACEGGEPNA